MKALTEKKTYDIGSRHALLFILVSLFATILLCDSPAFAVCTINENGVNAEMKDKYPGTHHNGVYVFLEHSSSSTCCNSGSSGCPTSSGNRYGVIVESYEVAGGKTGSYYTISSTTGQTDISATGYHFSCNAATNWYATHIVEVSNSDTCNVFSVKSDHNHLYEGQGVGNCNYNYRTGETAAILTVDNAAITNAWKEKLKKNSKATRLTCSVRIEVQAGTTSSATSPHDKHIHTLNYDFKFSYPHTVIYNKNTSDETANVPTNQTNTSKEPIDHTFTLKSWTPNRSGYTLLGWSEDPDATTPTYSRATGGNRNVVVAPGETKTLYAVWQQEQQSVTYTLSYNTNGGTGTFAAQTCQAAVGGSCGITIHSDSPALDNYVFNNWWTGATPYAPGQVIYISADTTLTAGWAQYQHALYYNANGGSGEPTPNPDTATNASLNHTFTISSTIPTRTGYKFLGWSEEQTATTASYAAGGTIVVPANTAKLLYAIWEPYTIATFEDPAISISSSQLTRVAGTNLWKGLGNRTNYAVTVTYHLKRTNSTPESATSNYGTRGADSDDDTYADPSTASSALSVNNTQDIPTTYAVEVDNGDTATACFFLKYADQVYYDGTTRVGDAHYDTQKVCIDVYNPQKNEVRFSGSVTSLTNGDGLSGTDETRTGSGYRSTFTITPNYTITRVDSHVIPQKDKSRYATNVTTSVFSNNDYPDDDARKTLTTDLCSNIADCGRSTSWDGTASTIDIDIGGEEQYRCFYLSYDDKVPYYIDAYAANASSAITRADPIFLGKDHKCITITNPAQKTKIEFTGTTSSGRITANDNLERSDENRVGKIINHTRITTGNDGVIGTWVNNASATNGTYTADFVHNLSRDDNSSTILGKTMDATVSWKIQYTYPSVAPYLNNRGKWVVAGADWRTYTKNMDNNDNAVSGTESFGGSRNSTTIRTQPKLQASEGQILYYCQRLAYTSSVTYSTITVEPRTDYGVDSGQAASMTATSPQCVTLKNPLWSETSSTILPHIIDVTSTPTTTEYEDSDFTQSGTVHEILTVSPSIYVHYSVTRSDNKNAPESYDESDANYNGNVLFGSGATKKFWQSSIYSNNCDSSYWAVNQNSSISAGGRCEVKTNHSSYQQISGFDSSAILTPVIGGRVTDGALSIALGSSGKSSGSTWNSSRTSGASQLAFNATGRDKYSVMAGQTRNFAIRSSLRPTRWTYNYKKINLNEYYTRCGLSACTTNTSTITFDRIEKVESTTGSPNPSASTNPAHFESNPITFSVTRPFNYEITSIAHEGAVNNQPVYNDEILRPIFSIDIGKQNDTHNYITDPNHTEDSTRYVFPVSYVMPADITLETINNTATGVNSGIESDICSHFSAIMKSNSCKIYDESEHPNRLSAASGATVFNPYNNPADAVVPTIFRHVYDASNYKLSYQTGGIPVKNSDGSPLGIGEKFCIAIAVSNYSSVSSNYFISNSTCRNIGKQPNFHAWGGSVITDGGIDTSISTFSEKRFGSWADFALIANKEIKNMSSGASTISGISTEKTLCDRSPLTIANVNCNNTSSNQLGYAGVDARLGTLQKLLDYFTDSANITDLVANGDGLNTEPGKTYIFRDPENDITLDTNIINNHPNSQVIIMAKNINIKSNVTRIDAWLIATNESAIGGTIDTCSEFSESELAGNCGNELVINGQTYAGKLVLKRTYGSNPADGSILKPAELINYSPSTILWGSELAEDEANARTVYVHKIPARF